jgi:tRNA-uridine 2-sulfurtransferase
MKILVALSGGIDSSTVAHLLHKEGHELVGVRFQLWTDPLAPALAEVLPSKCCNAQTASRTQFVAKQLGIPLHIVDLQDDFKKSVVDPFLAGYAQGLTPNPCIGCNREIKFGKLLELMKEYGCERLATGHYARVAREELSDGTSRMLLLEAVDQAKDQSYYMYGVSLCHMKQILIVRVRTCVSSPRKLQKHSSGGTWAMLSSPETSCGVMALLWAHMKDFPSTPWVSAEDLALGA